jgi:hypothetical protein
MFLTLKDLENMRMNGPIILVANNKLGIIPSPLIKMVRRYNGSIRTYLSLGTLMEPLTLTLSPPSPPPPLLVQEDYCEYL